MKIVKCSNCDADVIIDSSNPMGVCKFCNQKVLEEKPEIIEEKPKEYKSTINVEDNLKNYIPLLSDDKKYKIGLLYFNGVNMPKDEKKALEIFKMAARNGHAESAFQCYLILKNEANDMETLKSAVEYLKLAKKANIKGANLEYSKLYDVFGNDKKYECLGLKNIPSTTNYSANFEKVLPNCVLINCDNKTAMASGSGFIVDGYVITNAHVVVYKNKISEVIELNFESKISNKTYKLKVVDYDAGKDIAICKFVDGVPSFVDSKNIDFNDEYLQVGQPVFTVGNPLGRGISFTEGYISTMPKYIESERREVVRTNLAIYGGNSGGPLFNENCEIVGMISYIECKTDTDAKGREKVVLDAHALSGAVTSKTILEYFKKVKKEIK